MDTSFIFALVVVTVVLLLDLGIFCYLKKNNLVSKEDLKSVTELFNLATSIVDELNLPSEKYILRIAQIVRSALDFAIATSGSDATEDEIKELSKDYAIDLCDQFNIKLNESREAIIGKLIDSGLDSVYKYDIKTSCYKRVK